jgi:glycosyltransferase involved in cell wall biosynthesis
MVANLIPYKGHDVVLDALARLADPPSLRLAGGGAERDRLATRAAELGLAGRVEFLGAVAGAEHLWAAAQFGVLASFQEGLPNAVLEAMASGVPVVATAVGGVPELVDDGVTGLVVPPGDPAALAGAIDALAGDAALRVRLGAAARQAAGAYSWARCTDAHLRLYTEVAEPTGTGRPQSTGSRR